MQDAKETVLKTLAGHPFEKELRELSQRLESSLEPEVLSIHNVKNFETLLQACDYEKAQVSFLTF